ncbi:hypothetical protein PVAP13_8NG142100 [Panicum virgatum]|uniref:Uncharacterized protein n=1 Tax=Panicum virgatum TaxID=38727 RepID=A0A8T0PGP7_PANVG|nr:hypothetical protein PVAP13_8NG142100 [Panicum virgatum]
MNAPNLGYLSRHQGPRPRADATSEPHGRPPPPCTELDHGELLTLYPLLRRAHPASSSSTAPDVREEEASRCGRKEGAREWSAVRRDPSRAGRELHCSSTGADHCLPCPSALKEDPATAALASNSTPPPPPPPRGQAPLVVVSLQMVSTRFLPSAQLSISSAFASAKLGAQYWIRRTDQQMVYSKAQPSHYTGKLCHVLPLLILHGCYVCEL